MEAFLYDPDGGISLEGRLIGTVLMLLLVWMVRSLAYRVIDKRVEKLHHRYMWRQTVGYVVWILALLIIVRLWFEWFQSVFTLLSLVAAALVIISKEFILNAVAYGVILWRRLFDVGDRIQIGTFAGDVIETGPLYFSVAEIGNWVNADEATGRVLKIPNSLVLTQPVANYTRGESLIWHEITLPLSMESNWRRAKALAESVAKKHAYRFKPGEFEGVRRAQEEIIFVNPEPRTYIGLQDGALTLTIRYICKLHKRRSTEQLILEDLLTRFDDEPDVHLAGQAAPTTDSGKGDAEGPA